MNNYTLCATSQFQLFIIIDLFIISGYLPPPQSGDYTGLPYDGDGDGVVKNFGFDDASIRRGFIRKVYSILAVSVEL